MSSDLRPKTDAPQTFEGAAHALLRQMVQQTREAIEASPYARQASLLRGMLHDRRGGGYRSLLTCDAQGASDPAPPSISPSATAFRYVESERAPIAIDVQLGTVRALVKDGGELSRAALPPLPGVSHESAERLRDRQVTHLLAIPLLDDDDGLLGMVSLEASCPRAMGQSFVWEDCVQELVNLTREAVGALAALPLSVSSPSTATGDPLLPVVGQAMREKVALLNVFAKQNETLLLSGPTGVGKTRLAHWCHSHSDRAAGPFETVDLLGIPEDMQMAEIFGWRRGAFTGAVSDRTGFIERAEGGTLFLDEIDKLSLATQAGLLQLLETRSFRRLGASGPAQTADVRFIVGTNVDLSAQITAGRFREDLYFRVNVLPIDLPPLFERLDELEGWVNFMLGRRHAEAGVPGGVSATASALEELRKYHWPGNLRQLDNIVRRAYAISLAQSGFAAGNCEVDASHVAAALASEVAGARVGVVSALRAAARAWSVEARRRAAQGGSPLDLDWADAFRGFVLEEVAREVGVKEAFNLLGKEQLVSGRNHTKAFRRELGRVEELLKLLED